MEIRSYHSSDCEPVNVLIRGIQRHEQGLELDQPELRNIEGAYQSNGQFWVAIDNDQVIGTVALQLHSTVVAKLGKMFVAIPYRGSDKGVALSLLQTAVTWASDRDVDLICLETIVEPCAAHRFYLKNDFDEVMASQLPSEFKLSAHPSRYFVRRLRGVV